MSNYYRQTSKKTTKIIYNSNMYTQEKNIGKIEENKKYSNEREKNNYKIKKNREIHHQ